MEALKFVANEFKKKDEDSKKKFVGKPVKSNYFGGFITDYIKFEHEKKKYYHFEISLPSKKRWVDILSMFLYEKDGLINFALDVHDFELIKLLFTMGLLKIQ